MVAAVGKVCVTEISGVSMGIPNCDTSLATRVEAALTEICWPRIARVAVSNPSKEPGTRNPWT